jgi:mRNA-degrading endonuclease YafQ of YafQ-DinJ toxin-antitoxin module
MMAYKVRISTRFKKDFKRCMKRGLDMKVNLYILHP